MPNLSHAPEGNIRFTYEGRTLETRPGITVTAALYAAGCLTLGRSRKFRRPRGLSGSFPGGHLLTIDGTPHCRADKVLVRDGMTVRAENVWPSLEFDILQLGSLLPRKWVRSGFEHPRWVPDGSFLWPLWERILWFSAGMANPPAKASPIVEGRRFSAATVVVGGGPSGRLAAIDAVAAGQGDVVLISESPDPGKLSQLSGAELPELPPSVQMLPAHRAYALYHGGRVVAAAPTDPGKPAVLIDTEKVVLATGRMSVPPLVDGADLPGVLDARMALQLAALEGVPPGKRVVVIGTNSATASRDAVADTLTKHGVKVIESIDVSHVCRIAGSKRVEGLDANGMIPCDAVVHAGPWRVNPVLPFQAGWRGSLRLMPGDLPDHVRLVGDAALLPEPVFLPNTLDGRALVCPCMDVTVDEIRTLVEGGETHVEVLKRKTSCGMGTCQGVPCWDNLAAVVSRLCGETTDAIGHPTYRPPRAALTLAQAAGLDGHVAWDRSPDREGS